MAWYQNLYDWANDLGWNEYGYKDTSKGTKTSTTSEGNLTGTSTDEGSDAAGYKVTIPDPTATTAAAITGTKSNLADIESLASDVNAYNQGQKISQISELYPQYTSTLSQLGSDVADWASGKISQSTKNQLTQSMSERGALTGQGVNSANSNAALMSLLGTTSEALQSKGLSGYSTLLSTIPTSTMDVSKFFVDPNTTYNAQLLANYAEASPNPETQAESEIASAVSGLNSGYNKASSGTGTSGWSSPTTTSGSGTNASSIVDTLNNFISGNTSSDTGYESSDLSNDWVMGDWGTGTGTGTSSSYGVSTYDPYADTGSWLTSDTNNSNGFDNTDYNYWGNTTYGSDLWDWSGWGY